MSRKLNKPTPAPAPRRYADEAPGAARDAQPSARPVLVLATVAEIEPGAGGDPVEVKRRVYRRARSSALDGLAPSRLLAADAYAAAFEAVQAGGVSASSGGETVDGGKASGDGRQFGAMRYVETLRHMDAAIGEGVVRLDARGAVVSVRAVVRSVVVAGASVTRLLDALDVRRTSRRSRAILSALDGALGRIAGEVGLENANTNGKTR